MNGLDGIAAWELGEGVASQTYIFGGCDDGVQVACPRNSGVLISIDTCGCYAKAGVGGEPNLFDGITSAVGDVTGLYCLS